MKINSIVLPRLSAHKHYKKNGCQIYKQCKYRYCMPCAELPLSFRDLTKNYIYQIEYSVDQSYSNANMYIFGHALNIRHNQSDQGLIIL